MIKNIFSIAVLTLILTPFYFFLFNYSDSGIDENRILNKKPVLQNLDSLPRYLSQFEIYFSDNFPFRGKLIYSLSYIKYFLLKVSPNEDIFIGKDDMLFYLTKKGVDSLGDYRGINYFSERDLQQIEENILIRKGIFRKKNIDFYVIIVPNKESIYPENVSIAIKKYKDRNRLDQLVSYLKDKPNIPLLSIKKSLLDSKQRNSNLYYKYDSHWNNLGAFFGYQKTVDFLSSTRKLSMYTMNNFEIETEIKLGPGDLLRLIGLQEYPLNEKYVSIKPNFSYKAQLIQGNIEAANAEYRTYQEEKPNAYFYCDSFFMYGPKELIAESFNHSFFIWNGLPHDPEKINFSQIDIYTLEIAERYIDRLLTPVQDEEKPWIF